MTTNKNDYQKSYMKLYIKKFNKIECPICLKKYKKVYQHTHNKTEIHKKFLSFLSDFNDLG